MPKKLTPEGAMPSLVEERLRVWGRCIRAQRITQRITTLQLAERMNISRATLQRLERGDVGASTGNYLRAFLVLGLLDVVAPVPPQRFWQETEGKRVVHARGRAHDDDF
jgi:transcriptional regulator with XRE-family HTH domain